MSRTKPITAEEAIAQMVKRRQNARDYYARLREDARRYRESQQNDAVPDAANAASTQ